MVLDQVAGTMEFGTCIDIVTKVYQENLIPLGVLLGIMAIVLLVAALLYAFSHQEKQLMRDYLRRQGLLNKFEDWKKDRKLGD